MQHRSSRIRTKIALGLVTTIIIGLVAPTAAFGQERLEDIVAYDPPENASLSLAGWTDPAVTFGLDPATLVPVPEFDFSEIRQSTVLAAGVEDVAVDDDIVAPFEERYLRVIQVADTLLRNAEQNQVQIANTRIDIAQTNAVISQHEREASQLQGSIDAVLAEEERLADEIFVREQAIAEFAIRAFTGEDQLELVLTEPDTEFTKARVVTDEVREDLRKQIGERSGELAEHVARRVVFEADLAEVEADIMSLDADILSFEATIVALETEIDELVTSIEEAELLAEQVADDYELAVHTRLTGFVAGTNLPFVALNAYVIAARTLETEDPQCQIHWSQLAGIGFIESFHGYFGDSTLDVDGHTTEDILGLPLDGRILSGAEFVTDGADIPEATGRTEDLAVTPAPAPAAEAAPAPAAEAPAPAAAEAAPAAEGVDGGDGDGAAAAAPAPAPAPVIKRLALILDSDGGELDGDTVYDRAVGPMQFIPTTWALFDSDGNGDGEADPQNIYDASLASARYLCASTNTMTTTEGEQRAYFAYNHDLDYSRNVTNAGRGYRADITVESPEISENSGRYYLGISEGVEADNERLDLAEGEAQDSSQVSTSRLTLLLD